MVSWWPAEGDANDIQDGNDGTFNGTPAYGSGEVGQAFSFNGIDAYVEVPDNASLNPTAVTVDAWINPSDVSGNHDIVFKGNHEYLMQLRNGTILFGSKDGTGNYTEFQGSLNVPANTWSHVAITHDGATRRIYVNGVLDPVTQSQTGLFTGDTDTLKIGRHFFAIDFFNGLIDEVEVFNRALSPAEIASIYNAQCAGKCRSCAPAPGGMVSWWPGDGNAHDIQDSNNGTLVNGVTFTSGEVGQAFNLDGINDYVEVADSPVVVQFGI